VPAGITADQLRHTELAPAKINLALHVLGRKPDGYHELDSIVAFADIADRLSFVEAQDWRLDIAGPFARGLSQGADNLVLKAARAFDQAYPGLSRKYRITLEKHLPVAAGLGGGSADAAACLRTLAKLADMHDDLSVLAASLGADVPVCLISKPSRMQGVGEHVQALEGFAPLPAVLVHPGLAVATADVFAKLALTRGNQAYSGLAAGADLAHCRNDLTAPASALAPVIGEVLAALANEPDLRFARMSGSGATCFGIFSSPKAAQEAARRISGIHPQWWVVPTTIG
jgi:4-diphosphocytidyl-2-C-methyl-D-erythritol kinase